MSPETAARLVRVARGRPTEVTRALADGEVSFDRGYELTRWADVALEPGLVDDTRRWDIAGLRRQLGRRRRIHPAEERRSFAARYLVVQPSLDESQWRLWGRLAGVDGSILVKALHQRADELPAAPAPGSLGQRRADALVSIAHDSLTTTSGDRSAAHLVTIFVDGERASSSRGQTGVSVAAGPPVGRRVLEEVLCGGTVEVTAVDQHGDIQPVGRRSSSLPPRLRRFILFRDGGCTADGCTSRYRLQPHHIRPRSAGGDDSPTNLTTLCWYHHHVVVHGMGYRIDPDTPPGRRRFHPPGLVPT